MDTKQLFIQTLVDLHRAVYGDDQYELVRSAHLIRQLFLDGGSSLVHLVNRTHKVRFKFLVSAIGGCNVTNATPWFSGNGLLPSNYMAENEVLSWDQFQKKLVVSLATSSYSVHDIIDYFAHIDGGVHRGTARNLREENLAQCRELLLPTLRAIGRVLLSGLRQLRDILLDVSKYEDGLGVAVYLALKLHRMPADEENHIVTIGADLERNRISIFIDVHGKLCIRVCSSSGNTSTLIAGGNGGGFQYDSETYLCCEIGHQQDQTLIMIDTPTWGLAQTFEGFDGVKLIEKMHATLGTDATCKKQSHFSLMEKAVTSAFPNKLQRSQIREYFFSKLSQGYCSTVYFNNGAFLHSIDHPTATIAK